MASFYSYEELKTIGFQSVGEDVLISRKSSIYGAENMKIGNHVRVDDFCILSGHIEIGNYVHVAAYSALYGGEEGIYLEDYVGLSSRVTVYSVSDDYSGEFMTNPMVPDKYKNIESKPVHIAKHSVVGTTSVIMPGVTIAEGSAFGAFSYINRDSDIWSVNVGIPFKKVKERKKDLLEYEKFFQ